MSRKIAVVLIVVATVAIVLSLLFLKQPEKANAIVDVDSDGLRQAQARGAVVVDVRTQQEYLEGHIPGAVLVEEGTYASAMASVDKNQEYVIYCRTGNRSLEVVNWMAANGFTNIKHLNLGITHWDGELATGLEASGGSEPTLPEDPSKKAPNNDPVSGPNEPENSFGSITTADVSNIDLLAPKDGVPVIVQFSTTTCPACVAAKPTMDKVQKDFKGKVDVRVYLVDKDRDAASIFSALGGYSVPHFFMINKDGQIVSQTLGFAGEQKHYNAMAEFINKQ